MLFVIKSRGSYALNVEVVRADSPSQAMTLTRIDWDLFDKVEIIPLDQDGPEARIFEASFIE